MKRNSHGDGARYVFGSTAAIALEQTLKWGSYLLLSFFDLVANQRHNPTRLEKQRKENNTIDCTRTHVQMSVHLIWRCRKTNIMVEPAL